MISAVFSDMSGGSAWDVAPLFVLCQQDNQVCSHGSVGVLREGLLGPRLRMSTTPQLLFKASHQASPDARGGDTDLVSMGGATKPYPKGHVCREGQRVGAIFATNPTTPNPIISES